MRRAVVIGDGWSALGALSALRNWAAHVDWIPGRGSELLPPVASFPKGRGSDFLSEKAQLLELPLHWREGELPFRELRGKAFHPPGWALTPAAQRLEVLKE